VKANQAEQQNNGSEFQAQSVPEIPEEPERAGQTMLWIPDQLFASKRQCLRL